MERILHHPTRVNIEHGGGRGGGAGILLSLIMCLRWCRIVSINRKGNGPSADLQMDPPLWISGWPQVGPMDKAMAGTSGQRHAWQAHRPATRPALHATCGSGPFPWARSFPPPKAHKAPEAWRSKSLLKGALGLFSRGGSARN